MFGRKNPSTKTVLTSKPVAKSAMPKTAPRPAPKPQIQKPSGGSTFSAIAPLGGLALGGVAGTLGTTALGITGAVKGAEVADRVLESVDNIVANPIALAVVGGVLLFIFLR